MELRGLVAVLRRWYLLIVVGTALASVTALVVSTSLPKVYQAEATLIVGQSLTAVNPDSNQLLVSQRLSQTYAELSLTRPVLQRVIDKLNLEIITEELAERVTAEAHRESTLLTVTAEDGISARAAAIANLLAEELIALSPTIQARRILDEADLERNLTANQQQMDQAQGDLDALLALSSRTLEEDARVQSLENRLVALRSTYASLLTYASNSASNQLSVIAPATTPPSPSSPIIPFNTALGGFVGLVLMLAIAFLREYLDDTLKVAEDVELQTSLPTLGTITQIRSGQQSDPMYRLVTLLYPRSPASEAFRTLRTNVEFANVDAPIRSLLVTSSISGEGKTTVASNLAVAFAQAGRRTLLVDADLRHPELHRIFKCQNGLGLTTVLHSDLSSLPSVVQETDQPNLSLLPSGPIPPNPAELLGSQRMQAAIENLKGMADVVIFDSPPLRAVTDAAILAPIVDGTLLVIDAGRTRRAVVRLGREALLRVGARVIGATLNRVPIGHGDAYYGYARADDREDAPDAGSVSSKGGRPEPRARQA